VKIIIVILLVLLVMLQYQVWRGEGGIPEVVKLENETVTAQQNVARLQERNKALEAEVLDLKTGLEAIEERARNDLGMIRKDEVYYQVIEDDTDDAKDTNKDDKTQGKAQDKANDVKPGAATKP
jgi:cell division protein FtsB